MLAFALAAAALYAILVRAAAGLRSWPGR